MLYPACLTQMPFTNLLSVLFFTTMVLLGIDSQFGLIDAVSGTIEDAYLGKFSLFGRLLDVATLRLALCVCNHSLLSCQSSPSSASSTAPRPASTTSPSSTSSSPPSPSSPASSSNSTSSVFPPYLSLPAQKDQFDVYLKLVKSTGQKVPKLIKFLVSKLNFYMVLALLIIGIIDAFTYLQHLSLGLILLGIFLATYSTLFALYLYFKYPFLFHHFRHYNDDPKVHPFIEEIEMKMLGSY